MLSTPFVMTPGSGESMGLAALRIMQVFRANAHRRLSGAACQGRSKSPTAEKQASATEKVDSPIFCRFSGVVCITRVGDHYAARVGFGCRGSRSANSLTSSWPTLESGPFSLT